MRILVTNDDGINAIGINVLAHQGTDYYAVNRGHISITPLHLDLTNYSSLRELESWDIS